MADLHEAVITKLKTPQEIFDLIGDDVTRSVRVFGVEVPKGEAELMPRKCIVVRQSGLGGQGGGYAKIQRTLIDIACYGETPIQAELLRLEVHKYLKDFRRQLSEGFLLHSFDLVNGPLPLRDSVTDWPFVMSTWRCLASES